MRSTIDYKSKLRQDFRQIPQGVLKVQDKIYDKGYKASYKGSLNGEPVMITQYNFGKLKNRKYKELYGQAMIAKIIGSHPNVINFLGLSRSKQDRTEYVLVQQYGQYGTVKEFFQPPTKFNMKPRELDYHRVVRILRDVARAMLFLENPGHSGQIKLPIARTLKSNTVVIDEKMNAMLTDFGETNRMTNATIGNARAESLSYEHSSPEEFLGRIKMNNIKDVNAAHIWSFGILAVSICTGEYRQPFGKRIKMTAMVKLFINKIPVQIPEECPLTMRKIIQSSLIYDSQKRIGFKELVERLDRYYDELTNIAPTAKLLIPPTAKLLIPSTAKLLTPPIVHSSVQAIYSPISAGSDHYGIIDEYGNLFMVGNNDSYQLGNGTTLLSTIPVPLRFPTKIVSISCADESTGAVTEDGKVYLWGLTGGFMKTFDNSGPIKRPRLVGHLQNKFAVKIVLSYTSNYNYGVIFRDGTAYIKMVIRNTEEGDEIVDGIINISPGIIDISIGYWAVYILTKDGKFYVSGEPHLPVNSKYLTRRQKLSIHIGTDNINGKTILKPTLVPFGKMVQHVASGISNISVLTTDGELYTMSGYGEEGPNTVYMLDVMNTRPLPEGEKKIHDLQTALKESKPHKKSISGKIVFISNRFNKVAAVTENGELYMWRYSLTDGPVLNAPNVKFRKRSSIRKAKIIETPIQVDIGSKIKYLAVGEDFSIAVTEDRVVNYWGVNSLKRPAVVKDKWYTDCANQESYVTLEGWEQKTDYIKIYDRDRRTGKLIEKPACFDRQSFIKVMETQVFADWVPRPGRTLDVSGHGGEPGNQRFYKTILLYYIDYTSYLFLKDPSIREFIKEQKHPNQRIGNLEGSFGIGKNHGQIPGFNIYSMRPKN